MRKTKSVLVFYNKLLVPSVAIVIVIWFMGFLFSGKFSFRTIGLGYILVALLFHYFIYEIRSSNEYNFYRNIGISRLALWIATLAISVFIGSLIAMI
ncbi:MAG TPA: hypothetical protein VFC87_07620 [Perlabentimonas sp.]|nr:hypothetical protein [Perlabentimonas sp.]